MVSQGERSAFVEASPLKADIGAFQHRGIEWNGGVCLTISNEDYGVAGGL